MDAESGWGHPGNTRGAHANPLWDFASSSHQRGLKLCELWEAGRIPRGHPGFVSPLSLISKAPMRPALLAKSAIHVVSKTKQVASWCYISSVCSGHWMASPPGFLGVVTSLGPADSLSTLLHPVLCPMGHGSRGTLWSFFQFQEERRP